MSTITVEIEKSYSTTLEVVNCGNCHIPFAIPANLNYWAKKDGRSWYCPNGHCIHYSDNELARVKRERDDAVAQRDHAREQRDYQARVAKRERDQKIAYKGVLTKTRRRIKNGVCPCCSRTFANVQRHMAHMHPEFQAEGEA